MGGDGLVHSGMIGNQGVPVFQNLGVTVHPQPLSHVGITQPLSHVGCSLPLTQRVATMFSRFLGAMTVVSSVASGASMKAVSTHLMWEWESCTGWSLGRGGQPHHKIHYFFCHNWEGVLAATGTTVVLVWRGRFFGALIRRIHNPCNGLDFYETTCEPSHSHESEWVRVNHRKGGDGDVFFQPGWTDLLKGLPLNKGDVLTFQCEGGVILVVTTSHSMTGYEKVGSCGLLAV
ncbi:hypothetical protein NE237_026586 [Protea cynaroides]|uniref:Uncharacterized protein n=1 Tax=Protea cynaroides TaxID=273540 RepID=A0A9Q0H579_9MAGN|nr:hypothetical protein NE237_026586 [Protea cynaroides]